MVYSRIHPMGEYLTVGVMLAVGGFLWRQIASLDRRLSTLETRLAAALADVGRHVTDVDRRLATLEGRITGWQHRQNPAA